MNHFLSTETAARYHRFRPKIHGVIVDWVASATSGRRFRRALDVACGTGDSTVPLLRLADQVIGIDTSESMLAFARQHGLDVQLAPYDAIPGGEYDLISVAMAFHWFDRDEAVRSFSEAACDDTVWLIYNFAFVGHPTDRSFNDWLRNWYGKNYPSPPRRSGIFEVLASDANLTELARGQGQFEVALGRGDLIGYFTTHSNVEAVVQYGKSYADAEQEIASTLPIVSSDSYVFAYSYTIAHFLRGARA